MKKQNLNLSSNKKYVLACSYGPDSMALLNKVLEQGVFPIVAHVNYHHRKAANSEEKNLRKFCKENKLKLEVFDCKNKRRKGNFEAWAREVRYDFFANLCKKYKTDTVLVAHHQDDLIETYLMQKERKMYFKNPGLARETIINGVKIVRPLLDFTKQQLLEYCINRKIPYSIDITNFSDEYTRNKIRHNIVEKLTTKQRSQILKEIKNISKPKAQLNGIWKLEEFQVLSYEEFIELFDYIFSNLKMHKNISQKFYKEIMKKLSSKKSNIEVKISNQISIHKNNKTIYIINNDKLKNYRIKLSKKNKFLNEFLDINLTKYFKERNLNENDFPIVIKNVDSKDRILIKNVEKKMSRLFIDWKMPLFLRKVWPGIYTKENKLIYVPRYRENFVDKHKSKFVIKINSLLAIEK